MGFFKALLASLPRLLFLMVISLGAMALVAVPGVGDSMGPLVCEDGESIRSVTQRYSLPGETGTTVEYYCNGANGENPVGMLDMLWGMFKIYLAFFLLIIWPILAVFKMRSAAFEARMRREGIPATAMIVSVRATGTRINDAPVVKLEMQITAEGRPPFTRFERKRLHEIEVVAFQPGRAFKALVDPLATDKALILWDEPVAGTINFNAQTITMNEVPPDLADMVAKVVGSAGAARMAKASEATAATEPAEVHEGAGEVDKLRALKAMRDEGLIEEAEYQAKKAEIMGRL